MDARIFFQLLTIERSKKSLLNLPDEIVHDIMLKRLPVKSLLLSKAVCKSWCDLISDPKFVKSHLDVATKKWDNLTYCHLSPLSPVPATRHQPRSGFLLFVNREVSEVKIDNLDIPFPNTYRNSPLHYAHDFLEVLGSCNGLVLIGFSELTLLWNPSTRECSTFGTKDRVLSNLRRKTYISGLAYDSAVNEYKAVVLTKEDGAVPDMFVCNISRTADYGRWKKVNARVHEFPYIINYSSRVGITVNGVPHWVVNDGRDGFCKTIIYFDMAKEKFEKLPTPPPPLSSNQILHNIAFFGGCLCTIQYNASRLGRFDFDVWAWKEYGVMESWTKLFVIQMPSKPWSLMPLGFTRDGDEVVLLINRSKFVVYNLNTKEEKIIVSTNCSSGAVYVESLVSPKLIGKTKEMPT